MRGDDAFLARINTVGIGLVYCGYIGGSESDLGEAIAVDDAGNIYIVGLTASTEATFPVTVGPDLTYNGGIRDVFVAKVSAPDLFFTVGFESGDTSAWSTTAP